jgi:hypothetical protein
MQDKILVIKILFESFVLSWILEKFFQIVIHFTLEVIPIPKTFVVAYPRWKNEKNSKKNYIVRMHQQEDHIESVGVEWKGGANPKGKRNTILYSSHYIRFTLVVVFMFIVDSIFTCISSRLCVKHWTWTTFKVQSGPGHILEVDHRVSDAWVFGAKLACLLGAPYYRPLLS